MSYAGVPIISQKTMDEMNARAATGDVIARAQGIGAGVYQTVRTDPVAGFAMPLLVSAGAGVAFEAGLAGVGYATAAAASSDLPFITTAGRLASAPIAADIGRVGMFAAGTYLIGSTALDIARQPTATAQGAKLAPAISELVGFTAGASLVNFPTAYNPFKGREFISGELALSPLESAGLRVRTYIGSLTSSSPEAFRDVQAIYRAGRFVEPMRVGEPALEELSAAGPYAEQIRGALSDTPHSMYGSSVVRSQVPEEITAKGLLRLGADVDVYVQSPSELVAALPKEVAAATDPHSFPAGYPQVGQDIVIPEKSLAPGYSGSLLEKIIGEPISEAAKLPKPSEVVRAGVDYPGELTYEQIGVQFGRKSQAAYRAIQDPIEYGYRLEKDVYDFITLYQTQREVATGFPPERISVDPFATVETELRARTGLFSKETAVFQKETGEIIPTQVTPEGFSKVWTQPVGETGPMEKVIDWHTHPASFDTRLEAFLPTREVPRPIPVSDITDIPSPMDISSYAELGVKEGRIVTPTKTVVVKPGPGGWEDYFWTLEEPVAPPTTPTPRDFVKADKALADLMTREVTYAPVKEKPGETVTKTIAQIYEEYSGRLATAPEEPVQFRVNVMERGEPGIISPAVSTWTDISPAFLPSISTLISPAISTVAPSLTPSVSAIESLSPSMPSPSVISSMISPFISPSISALSPSLSSPSLPVSPSLPSLSLPDISFPWSPSNTINPRTINPMESFTNTINTGAVNPVDSSHNSIYSDNSVDSSHNSPENPRTRNTTRTTIWLARGAQRWPGRVHPQGLA
jgi:hypothetical protein